MRTSRPVRLRRGLARAAAITVRAGAAARDLRSSATYGVSRRRYRHLWPGVEEAIVRGRRPVTAALVAVVAVAAFAVPAAASPSAPACPDTVIPNVQILPSAVGCWNAIAVQTVRLDTAYPPQGLLYMGYVQGAVYDAVTKLEGRYVPYEDFDVPPGVHVAGASRDAATAAAAYTMLTSTFLGLGRRPRSGCPPSIRTTSTPSEDWERLPLLPALPLVRPPRSA